MLFVVVPAMLWGRSGIATVITIAWLLPQLVYIAYSPALLGAQFICHSIAAVFVLGSTQGRAAILSGSIFVPRAIVAALCLAGAVDPVTRYWIDYGLAVAQLFLMLPSIDLGMLQTNMREGVRGFGLPNMHLMVGLRG